MNLYNELLLVLQSASFDKEEVDVCSIALHQWQIKHAVNDLNSENILGKFGIKIAKSLMKKELNYQLAAELLARLLVLSELKKPIMLFALHAAVQKMACYERERAVGIGNVEYVLNKNVEENLQQLLQPSLLEQYHCQKIRYTRKFRQWQPAFQKPAPVSLDVQLASAMLATEEL